MEELSVPRLEWEPLDGVATLYNPEDSDETAPVFKPVTAEPVVVNNVPEMELASVIETPIDEELVPRIRELRLLRMPPVDVAVSMIVVDAGDSADDEADEIAGELAAYVPAAVFVSETAVDVAIDISIDDTDVVPADETGEVVAAYAAAVEAVTNSLLDSWFLTMVAGPVDTPGLLASVGVLAAGSQPSVMIWMLLRVPDLSLYLN